MLLYGVPLSTARRSTSGVSGFPIELRQGIFDVDLALFESLEHAKPRVGGVGAWRPGPSSSRRTRAVMS